MPISTRRMHHVVVGLTMLLAVLAIAPRAVAGGYTAVNPPLALKGIDLVSKGGVKIDHAALAGRWTFLSIGYTHCPDICPTILSNLAAVRAEMAKTLSGNAVPRIVFVSVDPARDTPDYLADYVTYFGKGFVGATGKKAAIDRLVKQLGAVYRLGRKDKDGFYTVSHSAEIYLIDPEVRLRARFIPPLYPKPTMAQYLALTAGPRADAAGVTR